MQVAPQAWKSHWLVTILEPYDGRSASEATVEPSATKGRDQGAKILDERADFYRSERWDRGVHLSHHRPPREVVVTQGDVQR